MRQNPFKQEVGRGMRVKREVSQVYIKQLRQDEQRKNIKIVPFDKDKARRKVIKIYPQFKTLNEK